MKNFKTLSLIFAAILVFVAFAGIVKASDSECTPPYSGYGGTASSCSKCPSGYTVCYQSGSTIYCYQSTKVGSSCTMDGTSVSGTCDSMGNCVSSSGDCGSTLLWYYNGKCTACTTGYANCDITGGCEVNLKTDEANCGSCGHACPSGSVCSNGTCTCSYSTGCGSTAQYCYNNDCVVCSTGYANCDYVSGCEVNLKTDEANCGSCGHACPSGTTCSNGVCGCTSTSGCGTTSQWCYNGTCTACTTGYANCDITGGCEVNLKTDSNNCGACGNDCVSGTTCLNGSCTSGDDDDDDDDTDDTDDDDDDDEDTDDDDDDDDDNGSSTIDIPGGGILNPLKFDTFGDLVSSINSFIFTIAVAVAPVLFVIGGFMIVTAGGNPLQVQKAQKLMLYTAIGLAVILLAQAIVSVVKNVIGVNTEEAFLPLFFGYWSFKNLKLKRSK